MWDVGCGIWDLKSEMTTSPPAAAKALARRQPVCPTPRPMIAVTGPDRGGAGAWLFTRIAVFLAGGRAIHVTTCCPPSLNGVHGLVVGGGADVDPKLYGADPTPILPSPNRPGQTWPRFLFELILFPLTWLLRKLSGKSGAKHPSGHGRGDPARDTMEMKLLDDAIRRGLPVLGICRGEQL